MEGYEMDEGRNDVREGVGSDSVDVDGMPVWGESKKMFVPGRKDGVFGVLMIVLGYLFSRFVLFSWMGWGVSAFTVVLLMVTFVYSGSVAARQGRQLSRASWFWFGVTLLVGISYSLYEAPGINFYRSLFLMCAFVYYVLQLRRDILIEGQTSNYLFFDALTGLFVIPFGNFGLLFTNLKGLKHKGSHSEERKVIHSKVTGIGIGLLLLVPLFAILIPLLGRADGGYFTYLLKDFPDVFAILFRTFRLEVFILYLIPAIPVMLYLCGLIGGGANGLYKHHWTKEGLRQAGESAMVVNPLTIHTGYIGVILLYVFYIGTQIPYFFQVFISGYLPAGFSTLASYARQGFFELLIIALINLLLIYLGWQFCKPGNHKRMKAFHIVLSLITELLILSAFSKFALYVDSYGLTMRRVLPCLFMVFLGIVFAGIIVMQFHTFSIMRFALLVGTAMMLFLSFGNLDGYVASYNADRYLARTLQDFDIYAASKNGTAALPAMKHVLADGTDPQMRDLLILIIDDMRESVSSRSVWERTWQ
jgi:hypothetical protein